MRGLSLLSRPDCHLCEETAAILLRMGVTFATIDVEADIELERRYGEMIPVLLYDDREIARAPLDEAALRSALSSAGLAPERS